jgi:hypothetical protein
MGNTKNVYKSPSHPFDSLDQHFFKNAMLEEFQVYNLKNDPGQQYNLYPEDQNEFGKLKAELIKYHKDVVAEGKVWKGLPKN